MRLTYSLCAVLFIAGLLTALQISCSSSSSPTHPSTPSGPQNVKVTGNLYYINPVSVSAAHPLYATLFNSNGTGIGNMVAVSSPVTGSGQAFSVSAPPGAYYLLGIYDGSGNGVNLSSGVSGLYGDNYNFYDAPGGACQPPTAPNFSGNSTGVSLMVNNNCMIIAMSGPVSYSTPGSVSATHALYTFFFNDPNNPFGSIAWLSAPVTVSGAPYTLYGAPGPSYYLGAVYDNAGTGVSLSSKTLVFASGDDYTFYNATCAGSSAASLTLSTAGPALAVNTSCTASLLTLSGQVNYTGGAAVNATHALYVCLMTQGNNGPGNLAALSKLTANNSSYTVTAPLGNYQILTIYDGSGSGVSLGSLNINNLLGDYFALYSGPVTNGSSLSATCSAPSTAPITATATSVTLTFGNNCSLIDVWGTATWTGPGSISTTNALFVAAIPASGNGPSGIAEITSPTSNSFNFALTSGVTYNLFAIYDASGQGISMGGGLPSGDYVRVYGPVKPDCMPDTPDFYPITQSTNVGNLAVGTACQYSPGSAALTGTVNYTPGGVDSSHLLWTMLLSPSINGVPLSFISNDAAFSYPVTYLPYQLVMFYGQAGPRGPALGDAVSIYGTSGCNVNAGVTLNLGDGVENLGTLSFDNSHTIYGLQGSVTYSGSTYSLNSYNLCVGLYSDSGYSNALQTDSYGNNPSQLYETIDKTNACTAESVYVQAWLAVGGITSAPQFGDPYVTLGAKTTTNNPASSLGITITDNFHP